MYLRDVGCVICAVVLNFLLTNEQLIYVFIYIRTAVFSTDKVCANLPKKEFHTIN